MDAQLKAQCLSTVYVAHQTGSVTSNGERAYGSATAILARVTRDDNRVDDGNGRALAGSYVVVTESEIKPESMVWLPWRTYTNAADGALPSSVEVIYDEKGAIYGYKARVA